MNPLNVLSPLGLEVIKTAQSAPRLTELAGKTIGEIWNGDFKGDISFPLLRAALTRRYPGIRIVPYTEFPHHHVSDDPARQRERARVIAALARQKGCDALISGNGA